MGRWSIFNERWKWMNTERNQCFCLIFSVGMKQIGWKGKLARDAYQSLTVSCPLAHWFLWPVLVLRSICTCSKLPFPPKPSACLYLLAHTILVGEADLLREAELLSQAETSSAWTDGKGMKNVSDTAVFWPVLRKLQFQNLPLGCLWC